VPLRACRPDIRAGLAHGAIIFKLQRLFGGARIKSEMSEWMSVIENGGWIGSLAVMVSVPKKHEKKGEKEVCP
jgi:hypothetical protein